MTQYNFRKLQIIGAMTMLNEQKVPATSFTLSIMTGIPQSNLIQYLRRLRGYFHIEPFVQHTDGCMYRYYNTVKSKRIFDKLADRYENGFHLNLSKDPTPVDWSGSVLLPGYNAVFPESSTD